MKKHSRLMGGVVIVFSALAGAYGQGFRYDNQVLLDSGRPVQGAGIKICTSGSSGTPCTPAASIFTDQALTSAITQPGLQSDAQGNFSFYAACGTYDLQITGNGITTRNLKNVSLGPCNNQYALGTTGRVSTYGSQPTAGPGLTPVYYTVGLTGQTASIGTTNITTSCPAGVFSLSYYVKTTTAGSAGTVSLTLNWNDGVAMTVTTSTASLSSSTGTVNGTQIIKCGASTTVSYATTISGATGSPQYSVDISIEQVK